MIFFVSKPIFFAYPQNADPAHCPLKTESLATGRDPTIDAEVIAMTQSGLSAEIIPAKIISSACDLNTAPETLGSKTHLLFLDNWFQPAG
jgi:hypothetical protein